eukprot:1344917-Amphidinium_carterae.1
MPRRCTLAGFATPFVSVRSPWTTLVGALVTGLVVPVAPLSRPTFVAPSNISSRCVVFRVVFAGCLAPLRSPALSPSLPGGGAATPDRPLFLRGTVSCPLFRHWLCLRLLSFQARLVGRNGHLLCVGEGKPTGCQELGGFRHILQLLL